MASWRPLTTTSWIPRGGWSPRVGHQLVTVEIEHSTLGAAAELACAMYAWRHGGEAAGLRAAEAWARANSRIARAAACFRGGTSPETQRHDAPLVEIEPIGADSDEPI